MYAKSSGGASMASFGDAWKVGSGLIDIGVPICLAEACCQGWVACKFNRLVNRAGGHGRKHHCAYGRERIGGTLS